MGKKIGFTSLVSSIVCLSCILSIFIAVPFVMCMSELSDVRDILVLFIVLLMIVVLILVLIMLAIGVIGVFSLYCDIKAISGDIKHVGLIVTNVLKLFVFCSAFAFGVECQLWIILPVVFGLGASNICVLVMLNQFSKNKN